MEVTNKMGMLLVIAFFTLVIIGHFSEKNKKKGKRQNTMVAQSNQEKPVYGFELFCSDCHRQFNTSDVVYSSNHHHNSDDDDDNNDFEEIDDDAHCPFCHSEDIYYN